MDKLSLERRWAWVYLINLVFFLLPLFYINYRPWQLAGLVVALILFIACYFWAYQQNNQTIWRPLVLMLTIATAVTPWNPGSISMFAYCGFFIGFAYRPRLSILLMGLVWALMVVLQWWQQFEGPYFLLYGSVLLFGVGLFGYLERLRQLHYRQKQQSQEEISQLAQMVERERIARDLHDIMGHSLSSIILKADLANALLKANQAENAQLQLTELAQIARDSLSQVRQTVSGYKHKGLLAEVSGLAQRLREHGFAVQLIGEVPKLAAREESALILVLTELVTNILRHSKGDSCTIQFTEDASGWNCQISDNGKVTQLGFGNGLTGVQERLDALQAKLDYTLDQGCRLQIWLPKGKAS
ncbi:MAG: sensor histidine kinase [Gammaproteobacteria bacterium]|nr:sensor histidine kinase [Gammaproteobacteria bacterium]